MLEKAFLFYFNKRVAKVHDNKQNNITQHDFSEKKKYDV